MSKKWATWIWCLAWMGLPALGWGQTETVDQILRAAATETSYLSFDQGLPLFKKAAAASTEGSAPWQQAIFGEAVCLQHLVPATPGNLEEASRRYTLLAEKYPQGKYSPQAMMALGRIAELVDYLGDKVDLDTAQKWYEKARIAAGENSDLAHEATLRIAAVYIQTYEIPKVKQGVQILRQWLEKYPDNPLASAMWQYAGNTLFWPLQEEKEAIACYLKADAKGLLEEGREGPVYWRIANLAERNGQRDVAVRYYTKIIEKTPTSGKAYESQLALKRMGAPVPPIELFERYKPKGSSAEGDPRP